MRLIGIFKPCWDSNGRLLWLNNSFWHKQGENLEWRVMDIIAPCHFWWERKKIVVIWSAVGKAGCTLWKCVHVPVDMIQHQNGRENSWCGIQVKAAASPGPRWYAMALYWWQGRSSLWERAVWVLLHWEGFSAVLKGRSCYLPVAHLPDRHQGLAHSRTDKVQIIFFFLLWSTSFFWWDFESSAKAKMAVEGQSSSLIGEVYRECLNISKKKFMTALLFWTQIQKIWCTRRTVLKKEKRGKHFPGTSLWHVISPLLGKKKHPRENNDYST